MTRAGFDDVVLLTGFPSLAARRLAEDLLDDPARRVLVHAVVRSARRAEAEAALDALPLEQRQRVVLTEGDTTAIDLGLSRHELTTLTAEIDVIHHAAQLVRPDVAARTADAVNVQGAREIVELAGLCRDLRCLVFHSTASVSGDRTGLVLESELDAGQGHRSETEASLVRAERVVRAQQGRLPIAIVRPTLVVGDAETGEVEPRTVGAFLLQLVLTAPPDLPLPLPGNGDMRLAIVPAGYVARVARLVGQDRRAPGRTYHIGDPTPPTLREVVELLARAGGRPAPRGSVPPNLAKALLRAPGFDRLAPSPRAFLDTLATRVSYSLTATNELLAGHDVPCPPFASYVDRLVTAAAPRA